MNDHPPSPPERERLIAWLDGELPAEEAREVAAWVALHPEAKREAEEHRRVWRLLGTYPDEPVPAGFSGRVVQAATAADPSATGARPRSSFAFLRGGVAARRVAVAASILVAVGAGVLLGRKTAPTATPPAVAAIQDLPADLLEEADVDLLASLSEEDFDVLLTGNPDDLAQVSESSRGG